MSLCRNANCVWKDSGTNYPVESKRRSLTAQLLFESPIIHILVNNSSKEEEHLSPEQLEIFEAAGAAIKQARVTAGLSQEDISAASGIDQSNLSKVERLGAHVVSLKKLSDLAESLGYVVDISLRRSSPLR